MMTEGVLARNAPSQVCAIRGLMIQTTVDDSASRAAAAKVEVVLRHIAGLASDNFGWAWEVGCTRILKSPRILVLSKENENRKRGGEISRYWCVDGDVSWLI